MPRSPPLPQDLAAAGSATVVLQDCLRWLALRGLTTQRLFQTAPAGDKRKLLALRHLYDTGRRPLRSKSCRDKDPYLVSGGPASPRPLSPGRQRQPGLRLQPLPSRCRQPPLTRQPPLASLPAPTPPQIANLLLLWLGSLPEPLFPASLVPALVESQQSDYYEDRVSAVRALLKQVRSRSSSPAASCS